MLTGEEAARHVMARLNVILEVKWKTERGHIVDPGEVVVLGASVREPSPRRLGKARAVKESHRSRARCTCPSDRG